MKFFTYFTFTMLLSGMTCASAYAELSNQDLNEPFGWANSTTLTNGDSYITTGGGTSTRQITLTSTGADMRSTISNALKNYDIIIFDGSKGDFIVSYSVDMNSLKNKTIVGINQARLCTQFYLTDAIHAILNAANVKSASTSSGTGGTLSNGSSIDEQREYLTRQTLIDYTKDSNEMYRRAGIFNVKTCDNIIIRNLQFVGPGSCDVGGYDLISSTGTTHLWVDHCDFTDGIDGNFDITQGSNFVTVSWCTFRYTSRAYDHMNTNLVGSSDSNTSDEDLLNITYANNIWGKGCSQRMPMVRFGTIHSLNNYFDCSGASLCINARKNSEVLVEGCYFASGVKKPFSQSGAKAYNFKNNYYTESFSQPSNVGNVKIPYTYTAMDVKTVPTVLTANNGAGATLDEPLTIGREASVSVIESTSASIVSTMYYSIDGTSYDVIPNSGLYIVKEVYSDGSVKCVKRMICL